MPFQSASIAKRPIQVGDDPMRAMAKCTGPQEAEEANEKMSRKKYQ
jgi:hypothetical protein